jgi:hypothetical protein
MLNLSIGGNLALRAYKGKMVAVEHELPFFLYLAGCRRDIVSSLRVDKLGYACELAY